MKSTRLFRAARLGASALGTLTGALLLLADSKVDSTPCGPLKPFQASFYYTSDCPLASSTGLVAIRFAEGDEDANNTAKAELLTAGIQTTSVSLGRTEAPDCSITGLSFALGAGDQDEYQCGSVQLPLVASTVITCTPVIPGDTRPACTLTFSPSPS